MTDTIKKKQNRDQGSHKEEPKKATIEQLLELQKHFNENYSENYSGKGKTK